MKVKAKQNKTTYKVESIDEFQEFIWTKLSLIFQSYSKKNHKAWKFLQQYIYGYISTIGVGGNQNM